MIPDDERLPAVRWALYYGYCVAVAAAWWHMLKLFTLYIAEYFSGK